MVSCLSVMELYGSKLLGLPLLPQFQNMFRSSDPQLNWLLQARKAQLLHGMYGISGGSDEERDGEQSDMYPRLNVPLHRSPAVYAALCNLSGREEENSGAGPSTRPAENVTADTTEAKSPLPATDAVEVVNAARNSQSSATAGYYAQRPAPGAQSAFRRVSTRHHPYIKTGPEVPGFHYVQMAPPNMAPIMPYNPSMGELWHSPPVLESINKSFTAPGELHLKTDVQTDQNTVRITGDKAQSSAIRTMGQRCVARQTETLRQRTQDERPRSLPCQSGSESLRDVSPPTSLPPRSQQRDNFRRLMTGNAGNAPIRMSARDIALQRHIAGSLKTHGVCIIDGLLGENMSSAIKSEVTQLHAGEKCVNGQLLKGGKDNVAIRGDIITWIEGTEPECRSIGTLCQKLDGIVSNGSGVTPSYKICGGTKIMVARYPGNGARYKKHVDNPAKDGRCLTCIYYINKDWDSSTMGGALRLESQTSGKIADISPISDRVVIFYSDARNPHEVLPCFNDRYAITLWYFDHNERAKALERIDSLASTSSKSNKK